MFAPGPSPGRLLGGQGRGEKGGKGFYFFLSTPPALSTATTHAAAGWEAWYKFPVLSTVKNIHLRQVWDIYYIIFANNCWIKIVDNNVKFQLWNRFRGQNILRTVKWIIFVNFQGTLVKKIVLWKVGLLGLVITNPCVFFFFFLSFSLSTFLFSQEAMFRPQTETPSF